LLGKALLKDLTTIIVNPISGRSDILERIRAIARQLASPEHPVVVEPTRGPGHATELARRAKGCRAVVVAGGDGTVRDVVAGLAGGSTPLAVYPTGTENILAKELGATADSATLLRTLRRGQRQTVDMGLANGREFLIIAGAGFDAEVVERLAARRRGHINYLSYLLPLWKTYWDHTFPPIQVIADGVELFNGPAMVFVGNFPRYSIHLKIVRDAIPNDGFLDLCVMPCDWNGAVLRHAVNALLRRHLEREDVIYQRCKTIRLESTEEVFLELDGDRGGRLPVDFQIVPQAITLLRPPAH
jgi:YegS/Rv2252/BmrU family lipid kinase